MHHEQNIPQGSRLQVVSDLATKNGDSQQSAVNSQESIPGTGSEQSGHQQSAVNSQQPTPDSDRNGSDQPATSPADKSKTEKMETHAHHLHKAPGKNFWHYFFEFFMLFLAVFCGFLAENLREHSIEHKRAKAFAASMIDDLKSDTADLNSYIKYMNYASNNVDTLLQLVSTNNPNQIPTGKLYWFGLWGGAPLDFVPNDATFQQMKSSGSLRYFTNKSIAQKVAQYDQLCRKLKTLEEKDLTIYPEVRKTRAQIFEFRYNAVANDIYQANRLSPDQKRIDSFMLTEPPLLTYDKTIFNEYIELVRSRFISRRVTSAHTLLAHARDLITRLRKEYHLR